MTIKAPELREKTDAELEKMISDLQEKLRLFRFDIATKQIKNNQEYKTSKRLIARIQTVISQRAALGNKAK